MTRKKEVPVTITYLEMLSKRENIKGEPFVKDMKVERVNEPPVPFYREMYHAVGGKWHWQERKQLTNDQLKEIIQHPDVYLYVLRVEGKIVGFAELDYRKKPDMELKYFGLVPEYIGKGYGSYFLNWTIQKAWEFKPHRLWLHTCSLDHPRSLEFYEETGFVVYKVETRTDNVPSM